MSTTTTIAASLDMRGKTITTFIAYEAHRRLADLAEGESLALLTDVAEDIDNDIHAWCRTTGQELAAAEPAGTARRYVITKRPQRPSDRRYAAVISDPGLEELLSPLAFSLAAALEGADVSVYFQGPAVRVLARGFTEKLRGPARPFSRFARAGLVRAGHVPAQEKIRQLQRLGARIYICGGSMSHFHVTRADLAFDGVTVAEYLTFMEVMAGADIHVFVQ